MLADAGVSMARIEDLRARSAEVAELAPRGDLLAVALAANHAFELVPGFFARFKSAVPAGVLTLDYLDFEAKLRARARDDARLRATSRPARARVGRVASGRRARGRSARGGGLRRPRAPARAPGRGHSGAQAAREAQHGLDLVDELEAVYDG